MSIHKQLRLIALGASCAAIGAGASAVTGAGAATTSPTRHPHHTNAHRTPFALRRAVRRAVHGDMLLATKNGFVTVTWDRGIVQSVNGQQLTLTEGQKTTTRTVTLTIPPSARIRDNGQKATLSQLAGGQRVLVIRLPKRTIVRAHTPHRA